MLGEMPWRIWLEWRQYHQEEPFDPMREDIMLGQISLLVASGLLRDKDTPPYKLEQFLPFIDGVAKRAPAETEEDKAERLLAFAKDVTIIFGGKVENGQSHQAGTPDSTD